MAARVVDTQDKICWNVLLCDSDCLALLFVATQNLLFACLINHLLLVYSLKSKIWLYELKEKVRWQKLILRLLIILFKGLDSEGFVVIGSPDKKYGMIEFKDSVSPLWNLKRFILKRDKCPREDVKISNHFPSLFLVEIQWFKYLSLRHSL